MNKEVDVGAYVLAAGLQTRFDGAKSKLMADIGGIPAFSRTVESLLEVFPESSICVVTSDRFEDFNNFVSMELPNALLCFDKNPGTGSANSLRQTYPWSKEWGYVTEGNIFYKPDLIKESLALAKNQGGLCGVISVTDRVDVAKTHRSVRLSPRLEIAKKGDNEGLKFRNLGAYVLNRKFEEYAQLAVDIIDVITIMNMMGVQFASYLYEGDYLHMENSQDVNEWLKYFSGIKNEEQ